MAEVTFSDKRHGYDKTEVDQFVQEAEAKLQEKSNELAEAQHKVEELEAQLANIGVADAAAAPAPAMDAEVAEKLELYDKLMKKMDEDYTNLLTPAIAKAKAIEEEAEKEYNIRIDQARYAADGIYDAAADRIAGVVDNNMDRIYGLLDDFIYSKSIVGRLEAFCKGCKEISAKAVEVPAKFIHTASEKIKSIKLPTISFTK